MSAEPRTERTASRFWDRIADKYARQPVADEASYQRKLRVTRELLKPDTEVLELGCGTGSTAIAHAPHVRRILAVDISPRMVEIARGKAEAAGVANVTFEVAALDDFDAGGRQFDVVMAHSILHLVADRDAILAEASALTKPGGWLVSSTACLGDFMPLMRWIAPLGHAIGLLPLLRVFTSAELTASIRAAGFGIVEAWQPAKDKAVFVVARKPEVA